MADLKEQIDFSNLEGHIDAGHEGATRALIDAVTINDELETALRKLADGAATRKYTSEHVRAEDARLRADAFAKTAPLRERAQTLIGLADAVDEHLAPEAVLRRARFEPLPAGGDDTRRLLAEHVDLLRRGEYRREVDGMTGRELAAEVEAVVNAGDDARLAVLHQRIKREGAAHIDDAAWSTAKSKMLTALARVTTPDHALLPKASEIRERALDVVALAEQMQTGRESLRLHTRRATQLFREGAMDLSAGKPFVIPNPFAGVSTIANN